METINDQLFYLDREAVKPILWSKLIFNDDNYNKQIYKIFETLLDPRMIFLDKTLNYDEIKQCKSKKLNYFYNLKKMYEKKVQDKLVPKNDSVIFKKKFKKLQGVFSDMENSSPQIFLYVTREYSASKYPGFLSVNNLIREK